MEVVCLLPLSASAKMHSYSGGCGCSFYRQTSECSVCFDLVQEEQEKSWNEDRDIIRPNYEIHTTHFVLFDPLDMKERIGYNY